MMLLEGRPSWTAKYKVEASHRVIDTGHTIAEFARELGIDARPTDGEWRPNGSHRQARISPWSRRERMGCRPRTRTADRGWSGAIPRRGAGTRCSTCRRYRRVDPIRLSWEREWQ